MSNLTQKQTKKSNRSRNLLIAVGVSLVVVCVCLPIIAIGDVFGTSSTPTPDNFAAAIEVAQTSLAKTQTAMPTTTPFPTETLLQSPSATETTPTEPILFTETPTPTLEPLATATFPAASTSGQVVIVFVNKDAEYVDIKNNGSTAQNLSGWRLISETGNQSCSLSGTIEPGVTLRIFAQSSTELGFNCGFGSNIWNNSKSDPAVLYNAQGQEVSRH